MHWAQVCLGCAYALGPNLFANAQLFLEAMLFVQGGYEPAVQDHYSKVLVSVPLCSELLSSAPLCSMRRETKIVSVEAPVLIEGPCVYILAMTYC